MCSGKSTVGKILAQRLCWKFVDIDEEIEKREGLSIPEIFSGRGEPYFRELELEVLKELLEEEKVVVSTGGGLGANTEAVELMKRKGFVVWLKVSFEEFIKRCGTGEGRPLLQRGKEELRRLLESRNKVYSMAHLHLESKEPQEAAEEIMKALLSQP